jgi:hypothetical protein
MYLVGILSYQCNYLNYNQNFGEKLIITNKSIPKITRVPRGKSAESEPTAVVAKITFTPSCFKAQRFAR